MDKSKAKYSFLVQVIFIICICLIWEIIARREVFGDQSSLIFPTISSIAKAFVINFTEGYAGVSLGIYIANSLKLLLSGVIIGVLLSFALSGVAVINRGFYYIYNLMVSIFDLLPGVALLPVVIVIFGISPGVIVFLVIHSVIWPMSRNILDGFQSVPSIYVESGINIGLKGIYLLAGVYLPASMTYILSGLKAGWARAWRGLISAEMIFGIASTPGLGLYINQMRTSMNNEQMYATLLVIVIIGLIVQYGILLPLEEITIKKWGMIR